MRVIAGFLVALSLSLGVSIQPCISFGEPDTSAVVAVDGAAAEQYPRVTALENALLGRSFPGEELSARLSRMETKVFGSASQSPDLGDRTDKLQDYAERKLQKKLFQPGPSDETESQEDEPSPSSQSDYPRIVALEQAILGQSFKGEPPSERLSRMESQAFGKASGSQDLSQRVELLERYAEKKLHKKLTPQQTGQVSASGAPPASSQLPRQLLSILGSALLGVPGLGNIGAPQPQPAQQEQQATKPREDEAAINSATPPPTGARLITKVGWCEAQVFGRTFPEMHLPERLDQLNHEVSFKPGKSGVQLMDDIGALIQVVQTRPRGPIGAATQPAVH